MRRVVGKFFCSLEILSAVFIFLTTFSARADADDSSSTNQETVSELFKTETVYPADKGEIEVSLTSFYQNNSSGDTVTAPISLEYGLTDKWQVEAEWDAFVQHDSSDHVMTRGIGDLELSTQYSFMNIGGSLFHISPSFAVEIPLGSVNKDLSEGFLEYEPAVIFARDFPRLHGTQLFTEIGLNFVQRIKRPTDADDAEPAAHELALGAGFFTPVPHGSVSLEFDWNNNQWNHSGTENELYATPGFTWQVTRSVEFGVGIPVGLNPQSDRYEFIAHIFWEF